VLYGRHTECAAVGRLLRAARDGRSGVLVLRGEAGVGKSALLAYAADQAGDVAGGMTVLCAAGVEAEVQLPFAALHQLLRGGLGHLPAVQAAALQAALGLAAAPGDRGLGGERLGDRFLVSVGVLSLLADAAEQRPLVCLLDDAHWMDQASADALVFAGRRLGAEGVGLLFAARDAEPRGFDAPGLPELRLGGLDSGAAARLLADAVPSAPAAGVADRLLAAAGGNPLALLELPAALSPAQLAGRAPLPDPLPVGAGVERAFADRAARLPAAARTVLLLAAADDTGEAATVLRAAGRLGLDAGALGPAEAARLVRVAGGRVEFWHPLVRSAIYRAATFADRRAAHLALAGALDGAGQADRRAWHRAAAAAGPDDAVAGELERSAGRALARGGYAAAAAALERAAELTGQDPARARRLAAGAEAAWLAGRPRWAQELADRASRLDPPPRLRADLQQVRGRIELWCGSPVQAHRLLAAAATAIADTDPGQAAMLLLQAGQAAWSAGDVPKAIEVGQRLDTLAVPQDSTVRLMGRAFVGLAGLMAGDPAHAVHAAPLLRGVVSSARTAQDPVQLAFASHAALCIGDDAAAADLLGRAVDAARAAGAIGTLAWMLAQAAILQAWTSHWPAAVASASEGLRLADETGEDNAAALHHSVLAWVAAVQGREQDCRAHADAALGQAARRALALPASLATWALGLAELGAGRPATALDRLAAAGPGRGHPVAATFAAADLAEAAVRAGRPEAAPDAVARLEAWATATAAPWGLALVARCRGLLSDGDTAAGHFAQALELHAAAGRPFDRARTELVWGEALRRARRPSQARGHLRAALDGFEQLGAAGWAGRARAELRASGETARRRDPSTLTQLTPQELQIARLAAAGATNREIASQLFVSPRTVEYHLYKVFPKLGIASRAELARLAPLGEPAGAAR
jgi:DNA-binding CsgD family transcriptional regulator